MPNTKMSKGDIREFLSYNKWMYIVLAVVIFMLADILYSATEYTVPNERQVSVQMVTSFVETETGLVEVAEKALADGQTYDETLEEVVFYNLSYDPENDSDGYGAQKYMLMLAVGEGDIYMLDHSLMESLVKQGYCVPLEGYIATGLLDPGDVDLATVTYHESEDVEEYDPNATHVYAIPMKNMNDMLESDIGFDNRDRYMVMLVTSKNPDTAAYVMNNFLQQLTAPLPEWAAAAEQDETQEGNVFDDALQNAGFATAAPVEDGSPAEGSAPVEGDAEPSGSSQGAEAEPTAAPTASAQ